MLKIAVLYQGETVLLNPNLCSFVFWQNLNRVCVDADAREVLTEVTQQVDVVKQTAERVSSSAEVYGAVQQEARIGMNAGQQLIAEHVWFANIFQQGQSKSCSCMSTT